MSYDDGTKVNKVNYDQSTPVYDIAIKYTSEDIRSSGFTTISAVKVYNEPGPPPASATVKIWQGTNAAVEQVSKTYSPANGWNTVALDAAYAVDNTQDLWIGVRYEAMTAMHPHACMDGSLNHPGRSNWMRPVNSGTPGAWTDGMNQLGDWNIQFLAGGFRQQESEVVIESGGHEENALFYYNGTIYAARWEDSPGVLHTYTPSGTGLTPAGTVQVTGLPNIPGAGNFYGFASDGETLYAVNQTGYIYAIDPATLSLKTSIETVYDPMLGGPVTIAYDAGRGGFWCSFRNWSNVVFIQKDGTAQLDQMLLGGAKNTMGLAYDDVSDGGPYLWASIGNFPEDNYAKIGRWNLQTGELTEDIKNLPDLLDLPSSDNYMGSLYLYRDIATGKHVLAGLWMSQKLLFAYDLQQTADPQSPAQVSNLFLLPEAGGDRFASLMWKNPEKSINGNSLGSLSAIKVYRDGSLVRTYDNPQPGGSIPFMEAVPQDAVYRYKVVAVNSAGEGVPAVRTAFIGLDVPNGVDNLRLEAADGAGQLTWTAPAKGENGGPVGSLTYTVVRRPGNVTMIENTTATSYTDESISLLNMYSYTVTAKNTRGESQPVTSNAVPLGVAIPAPWQDTFEDPALLPLWTIINANGDYDTWTHNSESRDGSMQCFSQATDDWLISPAIALESGERYVLSWYHSAAISDACHYTVNMGKGATVAAQATELGSYTVTSTGYVRQTIEITVPETGSYHFGWHAADPDPQGDSKFISIDDVALTYFNTIDLSATISGPDEVNAETATAFTVTVKNEGQTAVGGFKVELYADGVPAAGNTSEEALAPGAAKGFLFPFTPGAAGEVFLQGVVTAANDYNTSNDSTAGHTLTVYPQGTVKVSIGDLSSAEYTQLAPFNCLYEGNVAQTIYYEGEIGRQGVIQALEYYYTSEPGEVVSDKPVQVYMAMTPATDLEEGWITGNLELVYDGLLTLPDNRQQVLLPLQKPFLYTGGNLLIYTLSVGSKSYYRMTQFRGTTREQFRTRVFADRAASFDYANPGRTLAYTANVSLLMNDKGASLSGTVTGSDRRPVAGATVDVAGRRETALTGADGKYAFAFVPVAAACDVTVSKPGYGQVKQSRPVTEAGVVLDFTLAACESPTVKALQAGLSSPEANRSNRTVTLAWEQPDAADGLTVAGYRVYVNHERKAELPADVLRYAEEVAAMNSYTYAVSAVWSSGCESAAVSRTVDVQPGIVITEYPFVEGFESGAINAFWEEKHLQNKLDWAVVSEVAYENDATVFHARNGQYFALLSDLDHYQTTTRLTTPLFDLSALPEPHLGFWHVQAVWNFLDQDALAVYYKNSPGGKWNRLASYDEEILTWKKEVLPLPEPSATYWIAFEGVSKYGYGVMLDDITVADREAFNAIPLVKGSVPAVEIYPNPASDNLTVAGESIQQAAVYNLLGQTVAIVPFDGEKRREINVRDYPSGIYIVKVTGRDGVAVSRRVFVSHE
jgi:hypothetical protein